MIRPIVFSIFLAATAGAPSIAQSPPPGGHASDPARMPDRAKMMARRGADMALLIGLRPEQRPALEAMLRSTMPPPPPGGPEPEKREGKSPGDMPMAGNFADHLARMERDASQRADADRARLATLRTFYEQLDSAQKQRFEALMRVEHGRLGEGGGPRPGGPDGPRPGPDRAPPHP